MGVKVKSSVMCFYHGRRIRPGQVFELPDGVKPSAKMVVVEEETKPKAKPAKGKREGPSTLSEITQQDAKAMIPKGAEELV